mmetsp:Transcript_17183/g.35709  ORF Transcript_17183/g.35709 Transcript_17183/m.35709 type:complete len:122 (-) Transcript_17183:409-774(-)
MVDVYYLGDRELFFVARKREVQSNTPVSGGGVYFRGCVVKVCDKGDDHSCALGEIDNDHDGGSGGDHDDDQDEDRDGEHDEGRVDGHDEGRGDGHDGGRGDDHDVGHEHNESDFSSSIPAS